MEKGEKTPANGVVAKWLLASACILAGVLALSTPLVSSLFLQEENCGNPSSAFMLRERPLGWLRLSSDWSEAVETETVRSVLLRLQPRWFSWNPSSAIHALRLWGTKCESYPKAPTVRVPRDAAPINGGEMLGVFLSENDYFRRFATKHPMFVRSVFGWTTRKGYDRYEIVHHDEVLALAGELDLPSDTALTWQKRSFALVDLFPASFAWFDETRELEFSAMAYASYLRPGSTWTNRFGKVYGFDDLATLLLARDIRRVSCHGTHLPYAICALLAADMQERILSSPVRARLLERLREFAMELERRQNRDGSWDPQWHPELPKSEVTPFQELDRIRCTGHHLEWFMIAPKDSAPAKKTVVKAIAYLCTVLPIVDTDRINSDKFYNPWSHAARALVLAKGKRFASEVFSGDARDTPPSRPAGGPP